MVFAKAACHAIFRATKFGPRGDEVLTSSSLNPPPSRSTPPRLPRLPRPLRAMTSSTPKFHVTAESASRYSLTTTMTTKG